MVRFCEEHGIPHEVCGKVVVATNDTERKRLRELHERVMANGVRAEAISLGHLRDLEPHANGIAALHVPDTGIVDFGKVWQHPRRPAAGTGRRDPPRRRGQRLRRRRGPVHLIYPTPDPAFPFLGVHFTRTIGGGVHAGPNAVLALAREGYRWRDVGVRHLAGLATDPGMWRLARRHWRAGAGEVWRSISKRAFVAACQRLVPEVRARDLETGPTGVRAQALRRDGTLVDDLVLSHSGTHTDLVNAPSPAATAALEIGRIVADRVTSRLG